MSIFKRPARPAPRHRGEQSTRSGWWPYPEHAAGLKSRADFYEGYKTALAFEIATGLGMVAR